MGAVHICLRAGVLVELLWFSLHNPCRSIMIIFVERSSTHTLLSGTILFALPIPFLFTVQSRCLPFYKTHKKSADFLTWHQIAINMVNGSAVYVQTCSTAFVFNVLSLTILYRNTTYVLLTISVVIRW